jgi:hypothetical protein
MVSLAAAVALCLSLIAPDALAGDEPAAKGDDASAAQEEGPVNPYEIIEADPALWNHGWIAIGVSGALLISGAITGGLALKWDKHLESECDGGVCTEPHHDALDRRDRLATSSTILIGTGAVAALTGILILAVFAPDREEESAVALRPEAGPAFAGARLEWRF